MTNNFKAFKGKYIGKESSPVELIPGNIYDIINEEYGSYRVIDEEHEDYLYPKRIFVKATDEEIKAYDEARNIMLKRKTKVRIKRSGIIGKTVGEWVENLKPSYVVMDGDENGKYKLYRCTEDEIEVVDDENEK